MVAVTRHCTRIEVIASVKEQLDIIISDLRASIGMDAPESANGSVGERGVGKPGYAIIGTGMMGREHIRAILQLKQARIVGIFDEDAGSVKRALREFTQLGHEAPAVYTGLDDLTNDGRVDAILICTPNFTHRQVFDAVKHTGKPIFLEKPMATTLEDAIYLAKASLSYPSSILLGMQYRYKSQYQLALSAISNGDVGSVKMISLCEYRPAFLPKVKEWNKFAVYSGGTLVEKCCHYFDLMNRIAASLPARVFASGGRAVNFKGFSYEGQASDIETAYLRMHLDHDTGELDGTVLDGSYSGRQLSELAPEDLMSLLRECRVNDPQSSPILESYLDRVYGAEWRGGDDAAGAPGSGGLGLDVVGVGVPGVDWRAADRQLVQVQAAVTQARDAVAQLLPGGEAAAVSRRAAGTQRRA